MKRLLVATLGIALIFQHLVIFPSVYADALAPHTKFGKESGKLTKTEAWGMVLDELHSGDKNGKLEAIQALVQINDKAAMEPLCEVFWDPDMEIRIAIVNALVKIGRTDAIPPLIQILNRSHQREREAEEKAQEADRKKFESMNYEDLLDESEPFEDFSMEETPFPSEADLSHRPRNIEFDSKRLIQQTFIHMGPPAVPSLGTILSSPKKYSIDVRAAVAKTLGPIGDPAAVPFLIESFKRQAARGFNTERNKETMISIYTDNSLEMLGEPAAIGLISLLPSAKPAVRERIGFLLGQIKSVASVRALIELLKDPEEDVRQRAAWSLGKEGNQAGIQPLMTALQKDSSAKVRAAAAGSFGNIGIPDPQVFAQLMISLQDQPEITNLAMNSLSELYPGDARVLLLLVRDLDDLTYQTRSNTAYRLGEVGEKWGFHKMAEAMEKLAELKPEMSEKLKEIARLFRTTTDKKKNDYDRPPIVNALEDAAKIWAIDRAIGAMESPNDELRKQAANLLYQDRSSISREAKQPPKPKAIEAMMRALAKDPVAEIRRHAAYLLGDCMDVPGVMDLLITALQDPDEYVRSSALLSLEDQHVPKVVNSIIKMLADPKESIRWKTARTLGKFKNRKAVPLLISAMYSDSDSTMRESAREALMAIGDPRAVPDLLRTIPLFQQRFGFQETLDISSFKEPEVAELLALYDSVMQGRINAVQIQQMMLLGQRPEGWIRLSAAFLLGETGHPAIIPYLKPLIADKDPNVRAFAAEALGKIRSDESLRLLLEACKDNDLSVLSYVAFALGRTYNAAAIPALQRLGKMKDGQLRDIARRSLEKIQQGRPPVSSPPVEIIHAIGDGMLQASA